MLIVYRNVGAVGGSETFWGLQPPKPPAGAMPGVDIYYNILGIRTS